MKAAANSSSFSKNVSAFSHFDPNKGGKLLVTSLVLKLSSEVKTVAGKKKKKHIYILHLFPSQRKRSCALTFCARGAHKSGAPFAWWPRVSARASECHRLVKPEVTTLNALTTLLSGESPHQQEGTRLAHPLSLSQRRMLWSCPPGACTKSLTYSDLLRQSSWVSFRAKAKAQGAWKIITISRSLADCSQMSTQPLISQHLLVILCFLKETLNSKVRYSLSAEEEQRSCLSLGIYSALKVEPEHMAAVCTVMEQNKNLTWN